MLTDAHERQKGSVTFAPKWDLTADFRKSFYLFFKNIGFLDPFGAPQILAQYREKLHFDDSDSGVYFLSWLRLNRAKAIQF